ncbi:hypothetical protein A3K34_02725 [candidate division WWE3 bacterium RIFOXYC1_FULL_40_10]|uniref:Uncharacterized protein n=1 Tax=candidate division WWE3 bacterium RIFOXYA2_FULL_46_9 TaxID=1802636 RepID=A0A1F4W3Z2_UNCKA|nr:MAG: hypothetical protein A3K58_02725 [candidate division WWE3 bacterium RIFOXYB1_FULL_40_22]OGC61760.1 MAG: hypothetical protein A3K37_02725 [candidate division WWE3 bacterium RIFOXYA1_FULL_40_11]OGC63743.1 MAG: hypothetical protein A2264_05215 [candidate division WWE3 bacterium RIFOXYA2_FULL_46_9]OGC65190.1 MAG: hypothetical protein A2326_02425 [candidate division WWE3 bacterium RIFOXYB2_FULL_41_6]OGC66143.1 MAG: hypothetical protein A3K34_02725 [candidate division WWE3 bacterium RIFOXYC1_
MKLLSKQKVTKPKRFLYFVNPLEKKRFTKSFKFGWFKAKHFIKLALLVITTVSMIYIVYFFLFRSNHFSVDSVIVRGAGKYVNQSDLHNVVAYNVSGKNLLFLNLAKILPNLDQNFLGAADIRLKKVYPRTVEVKVDERKPLAVVTRSENLEQEYLIDSEGYVLGLVDKSSDEAQSLTKIEYSGQIDVGYFVNNRIVPVAKEIISSASEHQIKVTSMSYHDNFTELYVLGIKTYISNLKEIRKSFAVLAAFVNELKTQGKKVSMIDLRYDKVIVLYD